MATTLPSGEPTSKTQLCPQHGQMPVEASPNPATSPSSLFGPPGREIKSRWDTRSSWTDRKFTVLKSGAKATRASDGLSRPLLSQSRQPLCRHRKLASNTPNHAFGKSKRKKEQSFIWHLLCARLFYSPLQSTRYNLLILQREEPAHRR